MKDGDENQNVETQNEDQAPASATPATASPIDEERLAEKIFSRVATMLPVQQSQQAGPPPEEKDPEIEMIRALQAMGKDDEEIKTQIVAFRAFRTAYDQKNDKQRAEDRLNSAYQQVNRLVGGFLRPHFKSEPKLAKMEASIKQEIINKFNANPARVSEWNRGVVNELAIEELTDSVIEEFSKDILGNDKPKGGTALKQGGAPSSKAPAGNASEVVVNVEDLSENQKEYYLARLSGLQRFEGLSYKDAEKKAFELAKAQPAKVYLR